MDDLIKVMAEIPYYVVLVFSVHQLNQAGVVCYEFSHSIQNDGLYILVNQIESNYNWLKQ